MDARARLVTGLKRYFHGKRAEGLLGASGMQLLDYACNLQMDSPDEPLFMWSLIERYMPVFYGQAASLKSKCALFTEVLLSL